MLYLCTRTHTESEWHVSYSSHSHSVVSVHLYNTRVEWVFECFFLNVEGLPISIFVRNRHAYVRANCYATWNTTYKCFHLPFCHALFQANRIFGSHNWKVTWKHKKRANILLWLVLASHQHHFSSPFISYVFITFSKQFAVLSLPAICSPGFRLFRLGFLLLFNMIIANALIDSIQMI